MGLNARFQTDCCYLSVDVNRNFVLGLSWGSILEYYARTDPKDNEKSAQRCKHCALAVVRLSQKFSPHCRPHFRGRRTAKI